MVVQDYRTHRRARGFLSVDLVIAMAIFLIGFFSLAYVSNREMRLARAYYYDAVAMSLVDGELEVLAAGEWRTLTDGMREFEIKAPAFESLPAGKMQVTRTPELVRLEWIPAGKGNGRRIVREFAISAAIK
jgi:hypothetical protein